jgi:hypothetical protein
MFTSHIGGDQRLKGTESGFSNTFVHQHANASDGVKNSRRTSNFEPFVLPPAFPSLIAFARAESGAISAGVGKSPVSSSFAATIKTVGTDSSPVINNKEDEAEKETVLAFFNKEIISQHHSDLDTSLTQKAEPVPIKPPPETPRRREQSLTPPPQAENHEPETLSGALMRCEARVKRLDKLNTLLEAFAHESWSSSDSRHALAARLRRSKYHAAIKACMLSLRLGPAASRPADPAPPAAPPADLGLSSLARQCGADVAGEVSALRMLERQTLSTVVAMVRGLSSDVPVCGEEVRAVAARMRGAYAPAKRALAVAVRRVAEDKEANLANARCRSRHPPTSTHLHPPTSTRSPESPPSAPSIQLSAIPNTFHATFPPKV